MQETNKNARKNSSSFIKNLYSLLRIELEQIISGNSVKIWDPCIVLNISSFAQTKQNQMAHWQSYYLSSWEKLDTVKWCVKLNWRNWSSLPTVILFWVRVPVLSEQMTEVLPRVSTASKCFTRQFFEAIFFAVRVKQTCKNKKNIRILETT